ALGFLRLDGLGGAERVGGGGHGGVGTVGAEPCFEDGDTPLQLGDASVAGSAARAVRAFHAVMLGSQPRRSCASVLENAVNGYAPCCSNERLNRLRANAIGSLSATTTRTPISVRLVRLTRCRGRRNPKKPKPANAPAQQRRGLLKL